MGRPKAAFEHYAGIMHVHVARHMHKSSRAANKLDRVNWLNSEKRWPASGQ